VNPAIIQPLRFRSSRKSRVTSTLSQASSPAEWALAFVSELTATFIHAHGLSHHRRIFLTFMTEICEWISDSPEIKLKWVRASEQVSSLDPLLGKSSLPPYLFLLRFWPLPLFPQKSALSLEWESYPSFLSFGSEISLLHTATSSSLLWSLIPFTDFALPKIDRTTRKESIKKVQTRMLP